VTDTGAARQRRQIALVERVADEPALDVAVLLEPVVRDDPRGLLSAVLKRARAYSGRAARGLAVSERDADDAALLSRLVSGVVPTGLHIHGGGTGVGKTLVFVAQWLV